MAQIIEIEFERFEDAAKKLPVPDVAYSFCVDDDHGAGRDVVLVYRDRNVRFLEAA